MADPFTLATLSIGANAAGAGISAFGALSEGNSTADMYNYRAGMAAYNSRVARENRDYTLSTGERQALQYGLGARDRAGKIISAQAASGVDLESGSAVNVREGQQYITKFDLDTIRSNAARRAYGYEVEAVNAENEASLYRRASHNAGEAGRIKALASLVSGASSVSSKWLQAKQSGIY